MINIIIDLCVLPLLSISLVCVLEKSLSLSNTLVQISTMEIDSWFFIHVLNTNLLVLFYPSPLSSAHFITIVTGWEIIENFVVPSLHSSLEYFRENNCNIIGDLIAAIPAFLILQYQNKKIR